MMLSSLVDRVKSTLFPIHFPLHKLPKTPEIPVLEALKYEEEVDRQRVKGCVGI